MTENGSATLLQHPNIFLTHTVPVINKKLGIKLASLAQYVRPSNHAHRLQPNGWQTLGRFTSKGTVLSCKGTFNCRTRLFKLCVAAS